MFRSDRSYDLLKFYKSLSKKQSSYESTSYKATGASTPQIVRKAHPTEADILPNDRMKLALELS